MTCKTTFVFPNQIEVQKDDHPDPIDKLPLTGKSFVENDNYVKCWKIFSIYSGRLYSPTFGIPKKIQNRYMKEFKVDVIYSAQPDTCGYFGFILGTKQGIFNSFFNLLSITPNVIDRMYIDDIIDWTWINPENHNIYTLLKCKLWDITKTPQFVSLYQSQDDIKNFWANPESQSSINIENYYDIITGMHLKIDTNDEIDDYNRRQIDFLRKCNILNTPIDYSKIYISDHSDTVGILKDVEFDIDDPKIRFQRKQTEKVMMSLHANRCKRNP